MRKTYTSKEVVKLLEEAGFVLTRQKGSHARYKHPDGRTTTVPMHAHNLPKGTAYAIFKQARLKRTDF